MVYNLEILEADNENYAVSDCLQVLATKWNYWGAVQSGLLSQSQSNIHSCREFYPHHFSFWNVFSCTYTIFGIRWHLSEQYIMKNTFLYHKMTVTYLLPNFNCIIYRRLLFIIIASVLYMLYFKLFQLWSTFT